MSATVAADGPQAPRRAAGQPGEPGKPGALAIDVHDINKRYGDKHVVVDLTLQVARGEIFGFLGPNGSGKTTSIRMMCGLLTPDSGSGSCLGYDILRETAEIKRRVGYMTQKFSYWDDLSIRENLDFVARVYGMPRRREAVDKALEDLGLASRAQQLAGALSGGWKQRLALAACLLHEPELLLLDEPTAGVDPKARRDFWTQLHQLAARGISVLVSTHYMDEAERCHKLAYIAYGKLLAQGTASEVVASQKLVTWSVEGEQLSALSEQLQGEPGVEQTVVFGGALHVTGHDGPVLETTLRRIAGPGHRLAPIDTSLEDVFIHMMSRADDNMRAGQPGKGKDRDRETRA
ncbi:ABC transporter ATP-binding protein [Cupriavidus basilensis]|uniref:ABC transporter ATP-binding protein n=1 Tax=Cupriavidus basilensis TaxID=68895 RepID=A0ABT6AXI9_9BURK|nr:ABC transporter ATP-binding protein [Cupriavidus basilensis]MDF3837353.1 ABC transporter ATP-binding protein [Cupriavidus basilensis]